MLKILLSILVLTGCSKVIEESRAQEKHLHDISVKCHMELGEPNYTELKTFPITCPDGQLANGITRFGGLWRMSCVMPKVVCETCIDGVCIPNLEAGEG